MDYIDCCLCIIAVVYGFAFVGTACAEMGFRGTMVLVALILIGVIICKIEDRVKAKKESSKCQKEKKI